MNFNDLNFVCNNNPYPLLDIDLMIDGSLGYHLMNSMDAYYEYN